MTSDLTLRAKQTFQVVSLVATALVVGIHYKSGIPAGPDASAATWNELLQEFLFGGMARVAVPLFAFAAGFFYFRSDDGRLATYRKKLRDRTETVLVPYFLFGSIAMAFWLVVRQIEGKQTDLSVVEFVVTWLLRPPAEQLWFLRDLIVLVVSAPLIRRCCRSPLGQGLTVGSLMFSWAVNWQPLPILAGWRILHIETLLFFAMGCVAVSRQAWIERAVTVKTRTIVIGWLLWTGLTAARIAIRADFDLWYVDNYTVTDLLLHQASVIAGSLTLFMTAARMRWSIILRLSGGSFFVFLTHEFPVRAAVHRVSESLIDHSYSCWILTPIVLICGYAASVFLGRYCPGLMATLTGGRMPSKTFSSTVPSRILTS